ncbi:hypothetical protein F0P96_18450 [Hymenobacter busanensis]|uniref:Uncharacterized protein n=1 Tax=Hymenobacter busanensis TaxID=2607656 RepID=A0A7L4ZSM1_9BACT|nr:hypothetical protein [Hymenobacter busanensis]KAA9327216.1 hypothetical protein F0P96_18450 [Hymenobacter busanensis]QHJ05883.1 hypothetical protein GUY19_00655 [Hymenobacter busanensis]
MKFCTQLLLVCGLASCASDSGSSPTNNGADAFISHPKAAKEVEPALEKGSREAVSKFLQWYQVHMPQLEAQLAATVSKQGQGDTAHYQVNFALAERYVLTLAESKLFSNQFLADQRAQFQRSNATLFRTRQAYGPPVGFEFGWLLYTPQPGKVLANALRAKTTEVTATPEGQTRVRLYLPSSGYLDFEVVEESGTLRIASIMPNGIEVEAEG